MKIGKPQLLYALKLYLSAMLAYAMSVELGLLNPYWAMVTCCVLSNPVSGAVRARATYRFGGTLFAGVLTLTMSAFLSNAPQMLMIASGLSASIILGLSFLDRTPRAYFFQLSGVTMMLVAIAYINHPDTMFDMVVTRVTEICLGIVSVTLVDALLFPSSLAPSLRKRLRSWLPDMMRWQQDCLNGKETDVQTEMDRIKILTDIASLTQLMGTLCYDRSVDKTTRQAAVAIQQRLLKIVPLLSTIGGSIAALPEELRPALAPYLTAVRQEARGEAQANFKLAELLPAPASLTPWEQLVVDALHDQISQWLMLWDQVRQLDAFLEGEPLAPALRQSIHKTKAFTLPGDKGMALRMFAGILTTYSLLCMLWYATGWEQGANMVLLGVVAIAFFGATDNPGTTIAHFGRLALIAMSLGFILSYILLPLAIGYVGFLVVMALFLIPLGAWAAINPLATLAVALSLSNVNFQGHYAPYNLGFFLESTTSTLIGVYCAFLCAALFRSWGVEPILKRLERQDRQEMHRLNLHITEQKLSRYLALTLDRITIQGPRLAATGLGHQIPGLLRRLETSLNLARLRLATPDGPDHAGLLDLLSITFPLDGKIPEEMLGYLDDSLNLAWQQQNRLQLRPLCLLRIRNFPEAPYWIPKDDR
ncbi:FUSC family protein [Aeromonas dhakensis]|uniref:FUSC family protein n=1 Tax=Aeromonas dhakensis TaxID=196024 RepID=UPI00197F40BF|nr:FUSC family protein [Aeromonas dhakensis]MBW3731325.1 FUSC family protein [Aeromonas dhakensis]QSR55953.1 FUSC family protein [Aeromonas dhakensis]